MPYNTKDPMGTLRSMLHEPKKRTWPQMLELLLHWPSDEALYTVALPYCHDMLSQPDLPEPLAQRPASSAIYALSLGRIPENHDSTRLMALLSLCTDGYPTEEMWKALQHPVATPKHHPPLALGCFLKRATFTLRRTTKPLIDYLTKQTAPNLHTLALSTPSAWNDPTEDTIDLAKAIAQASWTGPKLHTLHITVKTDDMLAFAQYADLSGVETLSFSGSDGLHNPHALECLLDQLDPSKLHTLNLLSSNCTGDHLKVIARHRAMANLQNIDLKYNGYLTPEDIRRFKRHNIIPKTTLKMIDNHYEDIFE